MFKKYNLPVDKIHFGTKDKVSKCKELGIDLMIDNDPNICKLLQGNKIKTIYFRDKDSEKLQEDDYLIEVSNVGEICRYIFSTNGLKNSKDKYEEILKMI